MFVTVCVANKDHLNKLPIIFTQKAKRRNKNNDLQRFHRQQRPHLFHHLITNRSFLMIFFHAVVECQGEPCEYVVCTLLRMFNSFNWLDHDDAENEKNKTIMLIREPTCVPWVKHSNMKCSWVETIEELFWYILCPPAPLVVLAKCFAICIHYQFLHERINQLPDVEITTVDGNVRDARNVKSNSARNISKYLIGTSRTCELFSFGPCKFYFCSILSSLSPSVFALLGVDVRCDGIPFVRLLRIQHIMHY